MINIEDLKRAFKTSQLSNFDNVLVKLLMKVHDFLLDCENVRKMYIKFYYQENAVDMWVDNKIELWHQSKIEVWEFNDHPKFNCKTLLIHNHQNLFHYFEDGKTSAQIDEKESIYHYFKNNGSSMNTFSFSKENVLKDIKACLNQLAPQILVLIEKEKIECILTNEMDKKLVIKI